MCAPLALGAEAGAECRQALALGLDVSGSVSPSEYRLQIEGLANALLDAEVSAALLARPDAPVRLAVFEWSGRADQFLLLDWSDLRNEVDLIAAVQAIRAAERRRATPTTAIGSALQTGEALLSRQQVCWTRTLDLSGDGKSNTGPRPQDVTLSDPNMTVNGLVIAAGTAGDGLLLPEVIAGYYESFVVRGPGAFVETALGFEDFQEAMTRKLLRELESLTMGDAGVSVDPGTQDLSDG